MLQLNLNFLPYIIFRLIFLLQIQIYPANLYIYFRPLATCHLTGPCKLCGSLFKCLCTPLSAFLWPKKKGGIKKKHAIADRQAHRGQFLFAAFYLCSSCCNQAREEQKKKKDCLAVTFFCNCFTNIFGNFTKGES